jgi:hypothetical protein
MWLAYRSAGYSLSLWQVMRTRQPFPDSGPLWFVQILLYVSVVHALLMWTGGERTRLPGTHDARHGGCRHNGGLIRHQALVSSP